MVIYLKAILKNNLLDLGLLLFEYDWKNNKPIAISEHVNACFDVFWNNFSTLYDLYFPLTNLKFTKNIHCKSDFMTAGLLTSRNHKLDLHKKSLLNPQLYLEQYKIYRNIFNSLVRASKKLHYDTVYSVCERSQKNLDFT